MGVFIMQFYMLKNERNKEKDAQIIKSWRVNNIQNSNRDSIKLKDKVDISSERVLPFYSSIQMEQDRKHRINAMILLGGFKP